MGGMKDMSGWYEYIRRAVNHKIDSNNRLSSQTHSVDDDHNRLVLMAEGLLGTGATHVP